MSKSVDLANAIVALLNDPANSFVLTFEARRLAAPLTVTELQDVNAVVVSVFSGPIKSERVSRGRFKRTYKTTVAVHRRLDAGNEEGNLGLVDALLDLTEQFDALLETSDFDQLGLAFVAFNEEQDNDLYSEEAMRDATLFVQAIALEHTTG